LEQIFIVKRIYVILLIALAFTACSKKTTEPVTSTPTTPIVPPPPPPPVVPAILDNDHMFFGNPSNAAAITDSVNNYLMRKTYYALSYSRDRGTPNWVSWHLYSADLGSTSRQDDFRPDNTLPSGWYQVPSTAFSGSGFDRGHNCPSADRTSSVAANSSTFLMTNMIPQAPNNNQQTWAHLEDSLRRLVGFGYEVYIIMGIYGTGGSGTYGYATTINSGHVTVPSNVWKVAVAIPNGNDDSARVDAATRVISVNVPNLNNVSSNWKNYRTTIDAIEAVTGYDLLSRLPVSLQALLEAKTDNL
jgi:endonuclease G, mitochondrial